MKFHIIAIGLAALMTTAAAREEVDAIGSQDSAPKVEKSFDTEKLAEAIDLLEAVLDGADPGEMFAAQAEETSDSICCNRGSRDWKTSRRQCRREGGRIVSDSRCQNEAETESSGRVCCKRGTRDWFTTNRECRRAGGRVVSDRTCHSESESDNQVCCKRGRRDWLTTARDCRRAGGSVVEQNICRETSETDNRICCKRGRRDWLTTNRECRRAGGRIVAENTCTGASGSGQSQGSGSASGNSSTARDNMTPEQANETICCKVRRQHFWKARAQCVADDGQEVANAVCENNNSNNNQQR